VAALLRKNLGRKAMSQNGRREFLTSAAAAAAALAACSPKLGGDQVTAQPAQAQPPCKTIYDEHDIVPKVAPFVHVDAFRDQLITFPAGTTPTMANLTQNPQFVDNTLKALTVTLVALGGQGITTVKVKRGTNVPLGTYDLIQLGTTPAPPFKRSPVVLTVAQEMAGSFIPDWNKMLLFVIPDPKVGGQPITGGQAHSKMCVHPFGM
jgi:hypothetical protein